MSRCPAQPGAGGQGRTRARLYLYFAGVWSRPSAQQLHCCPTLIWAEQLFMFRKILRSQNCAAAACCLALQLQVTEPRLFSTFILLLVKTSRETGEKYYSRDLLFQLCLWIHISLAGLWLTGCKETRPTCPPTYPTNKPEGSLLFCACIGEELKWGVKASKAHLNVVQWSRQYTKHIKVVSKKGQCSFKRP